jgi:hypothetical protein
VRGFFVLVLVLELVVDFWLLATRMRTTTRTITGKKKMVRFPAA